MQHEMLQRQYSQIVRLVGKSAQGREKLEAVLVEGRNKAKAPPRAQDHRPARSYRQPELTQNSLPSGSISEPTLPLALLTPTVFSFLGISSAQEPSRPFSQPAPSS